MKVIDLLNKIENGEEFPKKIIIGYDALIYNEEHNLCLQDYYYMKDEENATWKIWSYRLDDEVEILGEKKIPEKLDQTLKRCDIYDDYYIYIMENRFRINEIIEYLDYLKSKENK